MEVVLITVFAITFVILLKISGKTRQERLLDEIPGPWGYPIFGNFFDIFQTRQNFLRLSIENAAKFGPIYKSWIGSTPIVFISKPQYVEAVLGTKEATRQPTENLITKSLRHHPFTCLRHRNIVTASTRQPDNAIKIINEKCEIMIDNLKTSDRNGILNRQVVSRCVIDCVCEIFLGVKINCQLGENESFAVSLIKLKQLSENNHKARFYTDSIFKMTSFGKVHLQHLNIITDFIKSVIHRRKHKRAFSVGNGYSEETKETTRTTVLDDLLIYNGIYLIENIEHQILNIIISALDMIESSIYSFLCVLGCESTVQKNILAEIEITSVKNSQFLTVKELKKMTYLDRAIKETLRLFPPCPFIVKESERDVKIGNFLIPYGTTICIQVVNLHRDPESFSNEENFNPDNFLPRNSKTRNRFAFIPFSTAENNCIGQKLTEVVQRTVLVNLIRNFTIETVGKMDEHITSISYYMQQRKSEIILRLSPRAEIK